MSIKSSESVPMHILKALKSSFDAYRSAQPNKKIIYSAELSSMAVEALKEFSYHDVHESSGVSLSTLSKWKAHQVLRPLPSPRKLLIVANKNENSIEEPESFKNKMIVTSPSGLEITGHPSFIMELLKQCGGLKPC